MSKKKREISSLDRARIWLAVFFGIPFVLNIGLLAHAFRNARHPRKSGLEGFIRSRFDLWMFTPTWERVHRRWVKLAKTEREAKDAFFAANSVSYGDGFEHPLKNHAVSKWLTFLTNPKDEYQGRIIFSLCLGSQCWTGRGTIANLLARARMEEFVRQWIQDAKTVLEARLCLEYAVENEPLRQLVEAKIRQLEAEAGAAAA